MEQICIYLTVIAVILLSAWAERYFSRRCRHCGVRMNRFYDTEEDAEIYQCPKCGRCYTIK